MNKRLQNRAAESRWALPLTAIAATAVWLVAGLARGGMTVQFLCFALTTYLMVELNNSNALIRIYSRSVSCAFLLLSCAACFTFSSVAGAIAELSTVAAYLTLFRTYQDKQSPGTTFYTFLLVSVASLACVHILYYVPLFWLLMASRLGSFGWRTFFSSLIGLVTPYWFAAAYLVYTGDIALAAGHFVPLWTYDSLADMGSLSLSQVLVFALASMLSLTGIVHYVRTSYNDKIRIRMFYNCFIALDLVTAAFIVLQPQRFDFLIRMMIINTSPLVAHFVALTKTRVTNVAFVLMVVATLAITVYNLWTLS